MLLSHVFICFYYEGKTLVGLYTKKRPFERERHWRDKRCTRTVKNNVIKILVED